MRVEGPTRVDAPVTETAISSEPAFSQEVLLPSDAIKVGSRRGSMGFMDRKLHVDSDLVALQGLTTLVVWWPTRLAMSFVCFITLWHLGKAKHAASLNAAQVRTIAETVTREKAHPSLALLAFEGTAAGRATEHPI